MDASKKYDYLIVGAGFSGSVLAERLSSIGKKVLVIDKRNHVGGNCFDYINENGILVHKYGPHYFRTDYREVIDYLSKFTEWIMHEYIVRAYVNGKLYPFPVNRTTLSQLFNVNLKNDANAQALLDSKKQKIQNPKNAEEHILSLAGKEIYEAFFKNYTKKQWETDPKNLDVSVTARIPIRVNVDERYFTANFQAMPKLGFTSLFKKMLKGCEVLLNTSFEDVRGKVKFDNLIYTGPIDQFFNYKFGKLPYRSLKFEIEHYDKEYYQEYVQINYPNDYEYTRIVEIKHATHQKCKKTTIVKEYPSTTGEPFYPVPMEESGRLFQKYESEAKNLKNTYFIGRLAQYKYLNMDQIIKNALELFNVLKNE